MADGPNERQEAAVGTKNYAHQLKFRGTTAVIRSLRALNAPKKRATKSTAPIESQYLGLGTKIVQLCESNVPLRRRLAHLSMIHAEEVDGDSEDDLELIGGQGLKDPREDELLALLRKQDAAFSSTSSESLHICHPSIQRSKSAMVLPPAVDQDVAEAIQHDLVTTLPTVQWTAAFEIPYLKFKQKRRGANLSSAQMFRAFLLTPTFRQLHSAANGTTCFDEDKTGEYASLDVDATQKRGLQKRFQKLAKPIRESLVLSLSSHMLDTLAHMTAMYTAARRDFLANMSKYSKYEREQNEVAKHHAAALSGKRDQLRQDVDRTKHHLNALAQRTTTIHSVSSSKSHVITTPRMPDFLKPIVSPKKVTKDHSPAWKRIKDLEQCNTTRSLQASVAYAKAIHTDGIGGGVTTAAVLHRQHETMACYIVYIQRHYRGHLARRYVWALKWMCVMWRYIFLPDDILDTPAGALERGFLRLDDFEAMMEYFSYQPSPDRIYLAGFALTVPPSRLGPQFVEYKRFKRYWHRFMYRPVSTGDRIRFVLFVRNRQTVVAAMDGKSRMDQPGGSSTALAQLKKYALLQQTQTRHRKNGADATVVKYQSHLSTLNDETKALGLRARRMLLPKDERNARGWALVRHIVEAHTMRQTSYKSVHHVVSHMQDVDTLDGRRRISMLREDLQACCPTNEGGTVTTKSPTKLQRMLQRLKQAVQDARALVTYIEEIGLDPTELTIGENELPPPPCVARLDKTKHVRGCNKLVDLLDRLHSLNQLFHDSWFAFGNRKIIMGPEGGNIVTSTRKYVLESMQLLALAWRQLRGAARSTLTKSGSMRNLHRTKRTEQFHELLLAYDVNIRNMSVILENYEGDVGVFRPDEHGSSCF
ncbi:hypothetical protein H310_07314 [Aphanomyces invadans]|uniref:Uncharacterized protein n=1 Tax=Aphanomyces invadans TaxID=157072 RepID=A0A024U2X1_9STRA|nr:hypothetical protein H310_07314 [Aphanomyces invadans]ETW00776.1 hypothetical protein H310_07314 [Aphanomyces invadans]|eukprot:XP_008870911.1 hypothetical protein H310_07314 [Aphanomyces invadans]